MKIRPFNADDAKVFYKWYHDERLYSFFRGFINGASLRDCAHAPDLLKGYILVGEQDGVLVGAFTLVPADKIMKSFYLGMLVDPDCQQQGYALELMNQGLDVSFNRLRAHKITAKVMMSDTRLLALAEKYGMFREGTLRESCYYNGVVTDEALYSILRREYVKKYV